MKLLKFVNSDAPHTLADAQLRNNCLCFPGKHGAAQFAKTWSIDTAPASFQGGYWLLDDNNSPICEVTDVLLAMPASAAADAAASATEDGFAQTSSSVTRPRGVSDAEVDGIDFRSKMGRQLERERGTYGATSKNASKSARAMMNAEEVTEKTHDRMKRAREALADAIENNDPTVTEKKGGKRSKKQ
ncbi:hypothetical protein ABB37_09773 [Leptomonas pyrrhocoris]|uniref:Uncharacterized protein n=1 Tax=Leptomonas pyrrhocoris TaxID=157538 RepID=A0A0N0DQX3_LEPPY|nr:hypothetical protein ABB37_09773 [Leptomonas pyrrhocoris]KPA73641.1 hypothetical protein ABB37_09773 [Leptomonas pyrrhocoris]|eukprot:XP_015652080.1 hypothetical protein ABB37_09773 [Leptomonas pyrrhocoris]